MAAKILMLKGISGSGKSTYAKGLTRENNFFRVNRDEIRPLIADTKWSGQKEKIVVAVEKAMAEEIIKRGKSVVIDDTNLSESNKNMWKQFAEGLKVGFEVKEIKTPLADCIANDRLRTGSQYISRATIERQALRSGMYNLSNRPNSLVVCDLDGTICDGTHREHHLKDTTDRDRWRKYFSKAIDDKPIEEKIMWLRELKEAGKEIGLLTGRVPELTLDQTEEWLAKYDVPYDRLWMRNRGDSREDTVVKKEVIEEYLVNHNKESIIFCMEDRPRVIRMFKELGLPVIDVGFGIDF